MWSSVSDSTSRGRCGVSWRESVGISERREASSRRRVRAEQGSRHASKTSSSITRAYSVKASGGCDRAHGPPCMRVQAGWCWWGSSGPTGHVNEVTSQ